MQSFKMFLEEVSQTGIYTCFKPTEQSKDIIYAYAVDLGLNNPLDKDNYHCTVCYSKSPFDLDKYNEAHSEIIINPNNTKLGILGSEEESCIVLLINQQNTIMHKQWEYGKSIGLESTWGEYKPHITLSYGCTPEERHRLFYNEEESLLSPKTNPYDNSVDFSILRNKVNNFYPNYGEKTALGPYYKLNTIKYPIKLVGEFKEKLENDKF